MSKSIAQMADEIMAGDLTDPSTPAAFNSPLNRENELPQITDADRDSLLAESMGSCMMREKLGSELKKHATQGTTSYSPGGSEKDTKVTVSKDDEATLSPKAKSKLKSHRQRKASMSDERTSWAVDRQSSHQKAKWGRESDRQQRHTDSRGQSTRGAESKPGTTNVAHIGGGPVKNNDTRTMTSRQSKLSPANQEKVAASKQGHRDTRRAKYVADKAASDEASRKEMREKAAERRRAAGIKKRELSTEDKKPVTPATQLGDIPRNKKGKDADGNPAKSQVGQRTPLIGPKGRTRMQRRIAAGTPKPELSTEQLNILQQARDIMREVTAVGGIGVGKMDGSANKAYDTNAKPMGKDMVAVAPVDKSLSKTSKKLTPKAKKKAKKKVKTESLDLFLGRIITESQQQC
jgi:hypothetical protein